MRVALSLLGCEALAFETWGQPTTAEHKGDVTANPMGVGFTNPYMGHGNEEDR